MPLQIIDHSMTSAVITVELGSADDAFVCAGVSVVSTNDFAISSSGDDQTLNLQGSAFAALSAIDMGSGANDSTGLHLIIGTDGYAGTSSENDPAVVMRGTGNRVDNAGFIDGEAFGLELKGGPNSFGQTNIVNNSGRIEGAVYGVYRQDGNEGNETIIFNNSGVVRTSDPGGYSYFSVHHESTDHIANSGLMVGDITLGEGDDIYDGTGGRVIGEVFGGFMDDTLIGGDIEDSLHGGNQEDAVSGAGGNDKLFGDGQMDTLSGGTGNDSLDGGDDADTMDGGAGNDSFTVGEVGDKAIDTGGGVDDVFSSVTFNFNNAAQAVGTLDNLRLIGNANINGTGNALANSINGNFGINFLHGMAGNDIVSGDDGNDRLWGEAGNDTLAGGNGTDMLYGGLGNDRMTGGALADKFVFDSKPNNALNRDVITDFQHGVDKIQLSHGVFAGIGAGGGLNPAFFFQGAAAHDANDRIVYNKATGALSYDSDGTGAHAAIQFAVLSTRPGLSAVDFQVI